MPWLEPHGPSRPGSPMGSPQLDSSLAEISSMSTTAPSSAAAASVSFIPPLIDGSCGSVPLAQRPPMMLFRKDLRAFAAVTPELVRGVWRDLFAGYRGMSWRDVAEVAVQTALCVFELYIVMAFVPMWLFLPGGFFAVWLAGCVAAVIAASSFLNGKEEVIRCEQNTDNWMVGQDSEDERWIFLGGMGLSARSLSHKTLPRLSRLFYRQIFAVHMPTYGLVFDAIVAVIHRTVPLPTAHSRTLYNELRTALMKPSTNRVVLLAHNQGAIAAARALTQLYADFSAEKIAKIEVYTFGALAAEFLLPLGELKNPRDQAHVVSDHREPHIEHFAHATDPWAKFGILRSVRENLAGRYCGGVFVIKEKPVPTTATTAAAPTTSASVRLETSSIESYLSSLFPSQTPGFSSAPSMLDSIMDIDRDIAEKREFTAIANYQASTRGKSGNGKRLSWTGLGAMAGGGSGANGVIDCGVLGLEMARQGCRDCAGHRGREVSWLARYVGVGGFEGKMPNASGQM